jgi:hypothetical protein
MVATARERDAASCTTEFELRLDQDDRPPRRPRAGDRGAEHQTQGDEGDVRDEEVRGVGQEVGRQVPRVDAFQYGHPRIDAEPMIELAVPHVERDHPGGTPLQ